MRRPPAREHRGEFFGTGHRLAGFPEATLRNQSVSRRMSTKPPPVPPANRTSKGAGSDPQLAESDMPRRPERRNVDQQGRYANTKQNTTVQGNHGKRER